MVLLRILCVVAALMVPGMAEAQEPANVWTPVGPQFSTVLSMARNPAAPNVIYAGTYFGGLYRSLDYGFTWQPLATEFSPRSIFSIAISGSGQAIYVATFQGGVYRSVDGGDTWAAVNTGITDLDVQAVAVDPANADVALAATSNGGVFRTANGGGAWERVDTPSQSLRGKAIVFHPETTGVVYLGTIGQGVFQSVDGGLTFEPFNTGLAASSVLSLRFGALPSRSLYAATTDGAFKLATGAASWTNISGDLPPYPLGDLLPHPVYDGLTFAATLVGAYVIAGDGASTSWTQWTDMPTRMLEIDPTGTVIHAASIHGDLQATVDFGQMWYQANWGIQNVFVGALGVVDAGIGGPVVYAGSDAAIFRNVLGGWEQFFDQKQGIFDIQPDPQTPGTLYVGTERSGVWKSSDWGSSWAQSSESIVPAQVYGFGQSANGHMLFAGTSSGLYLSADNGGTWLLSSAADLGIVLSVAPDPTRFPIVFVGGANGQVLRSEDGGFAFANASNGLPFENVMSLVTAPWEKTYAITSGGGLYATSDDGHNWFPAKPGVAEAAMAIAVDPVRSWVLYLGTNGGGVYKSESASLTWAPANAGLTSPFVFSIAVDPLQPDIVYAGTFDGVFRSADGALSWTRRSTGLPDGAVTSVVIDPATPGVVFASVQDAGIYRSGDSGASWVQVSATMPSAGAVPLLIDRLVPSRMFAGTSLNGVFLSTDAGATWNRSSHGMTLFVRGLAIDPQTPGTLYAGSLGAGVFKSTDGAESWTNVGLRDRNIFKLAIDPANPQTVYAATSRGLSRSADGGASWRGLGQKAAFVHSMVVDPRDRNRIFVGTTAGSVFRSSDGGQTWEEAGHGLPPYTIFALAIDATTGALYAGPERQGVWRSTNHGDSWDAFGGGLGDVMVVALSVAANHAVHAATVGSGVFVNTGSGWTLASNGLASPMIADVKALSESVLVAASYDSGIFRSVDGGMNWTWSSTGLTTSRVSSLSVDPFAASRIYAATPDGVFRSDDGGQLWTALNTGMRGVNTWSVTVDPESASRLYAGTNGQGVFRSLDGGATWAPSASGLSIPDVRVVVPGPGSSILAGTLGGGVARSLDGGVTWAGAVTLDLSNSFVLSVVVNPRNPSIVYAGTAGRGVMRSTNGGVDWRPVTNGLGSLFILSMAIDTEHPEIVYAGTADAGVFVSGNSGGSWRPLNDGLFNHVVTSLAVSPADPSQVFAGTEGGGVFSARVALPTTHCSYVSSQTLLHAPATPGTVALQLETQPGCEWRVESSVAWLTVEGSAVRTGPGTVSITAAINVGQDARSAVVTVAGEPIVVLQQGFARHFRLTVNRIGAGSGRVSSDWIGIDCGPDCEQLFTDSLPVTLSAVADQGSAFAGWEGDADCHDGQVVMLGDRTCVARFELNDDFDEDGLPNVWEMQFGLDPATALGGDGSDGDPDGDGRTNAQELADGTHPRGFVTAHFATGERTATSTTTLHLFNAGAASANVLVHLLAGAGGGHHVYKSIGAQQRAEIDAASISGLDGSFAVTIESDVAVVAERTMLRDAPHTTLSDAAQAAAPTWFIAGGSTRHDLGLQYVVYNPGPDAATIDVIHLPAGAPLYMRQLTVAPGARLLIDAAADVGANHDVSGAISSTRPVVVDAFATTSSGDAWLGSLATPTPGYLEFLSAARTSAFETTAIDVFNITGADNSLTFFYLLSTGAVVARTHNVGPYQSLQINPAAEDAILQEAEFGVIATSPNPFVLTTRTWWPGSSGDWYEGAATVGSTTAGRRWAIAGGEIGGGANLEMEIAITNVTPTSGSAAIRLVFDDGTSSEGSVSLPAFTQRTVDIAAMFPDAAFRRFSVMVTATAASGAPPQIVVEHSSFTSPGGVARAGGTRALATRLPEQ